MTSLVHAILVFVGLAAAMLGLLHLGYRLGERRRANESAEEIVGLVSIETAIFGLLGLVLAFTYSGAASRFEQRRVLTVQEANAIGTAWLRLDLVPQPAQDALKAKMKGYGRKHVEAYQLLPDFPAFEARLAEAKAMQAEIWKGAVAALRDAPAPATQLVIPALNDLMDITSTREALVQVYTPGPIVATLVVLALCCSLLAGYGLAGSKSLSRYLHMAGFALVVSGTIYIVLDYDHPRFGLIRVDFADAALGAAVAAMK
jgi:uncharacterized protein Usg